MRNQQNGRNPQAGQLSSPYQIRELKERLDSVEVDQESLKSQVDNVEKKAEESASGSGESGTNATFLYLRAQNGPAIKNSSGSVTFDIMKVEGNDSADVYQGSDFDIRNYDPTKSGASGQNFGQQVTLNASDIDGKQALYLCVSDGSEVVDTDTAVDITDGQGGGYVEAVTPVTATYLQQDASFTISPLKVRGYFYKTGTTTNPEIARVQLYPTYDGSLKATYTKTKDLDSDGTSPISVSVQNQNGNALNEGQSATAKLAREVVVKFTYEDPNTSQTAVATETLYLTTETGPGDYVSYVFQRSDSQPSRPANSAGGTYNDPSVPTDWSDAPPVGEKRLWLSKATYEYASDGPVDTDEDGNVWSTPVRLKGEDSGLFTLFASKPKPTDPSKTNISGRPGSTTWSGSADWKTTPNDLSTDAYYMARAVWKNESWQSFDVTRIKGEKGDAAQIVRIDASSQVFTLQKDGTHAPSSITLRAVQQNIDNPTFEWTYNGSTTQSTNVSILPEDLGDDGTVSVTLSEVGTSNSDEITLVRVTEGADASTVVLSNQNHTYPADQDGNVDSSLFSKGASEIEAYVGASRANVLQSRLGAASASQKGGTTTSGFAHVLYDGSASNLGLSSGDDVTFVGEIRTAQNTSQSGRLLVEFWDGSGGKISDIKSDLENSTEWQSLSTNGAVPTGTNRIVLGYAVESVSSGNEQLVEGRYGSIHKSTQPLPAYNAYISETNINGSVDRSQPQTISYEPSGSMTNDRASALVTFKIVREDGEVEARDKQIEYSKARAGTDSEVLSLSASSQVFAVNKSGNVSTQNPISLLVNQQNISSSVTWKTKNADGTDSPVTLTSKSDSLAELSYSDLENAGKQQVTVRAEAGGYSDEVTIAIVREGKDAVTALLSNENHSYSASSDGSVSDYSTGATTLSVYEGANKLSGGGGTPGFSVSVTKNNVSGSYSSGTFTPSGMSAGEGSVNFEITVTKSDGSTQTINKTATYSVVTDGASASSVSIEAESQVFRVSKSGSVSPSQIGLNSVKQNVSSVSWSASDNVSFDSTPKSGYDQSVSKSSLDANGVGQVSITASGGGDSDTLTLAIIREGSDALTPILTNENHTFTAASDGTIAGSEYSSGATDVKIYEGATQLSADSTSNPSNGTFNVSSVTTTNINASKTENASSFTISPSGGMDNSESASIDITIDVVKQNGDEATITKTVTYSKSVAGADGSDAKAVSLSAQSQIFAVNQSDSVTTVNPIEFTANKENISSGFSWSTFNTNGNDSPVTLSSTNGNTATLSYSDLTGASEKEVTVRASAGGLFDEITVSIVEDGTDAVTVLLSNENHTYQAQSDGTVPDYSTGKTTIKAYRGDSQLSVGSDFSVSKSESNVSGNLVDAVYTPTGMSSGEGSVEFTVTVNKAGGGTETFTKTATYSKSIAGEDNQDFDFLGVDKSKIKDTAGLYTNNDFLGYFRDDANGSLNPNERARAYLDNSGNFYLNDQNGDTGLVYESNLSGGNGIFAVGDIGEAKDYHQGNSVSSSSSFLSYSKASSNSELVFKGEIDAFGRIESFNPGGELAVRIDNDETFNTPTSSNNQSDSSFTLSSSGDSTTTSVSIESGTNEVTITISGDAGYFEIGGGDNQFEGGTYDIPSSMQVELKASSSGALLTEEWLQINESSVSGKTVSVSFDGQGHAGENIEIVVSNVYANNGNISLNGITVKSYTPTTEINARGVQVAYTSTDYVRIGASGITSTGGIETGSGAGVNFTSEGKLYADGSALYWSSGSNLTRIDSKVVEGTSGDSDKLDGNHGSYYLDASNINAGTLGTSYVPNLSASKITSGTLGTGRIPNLDASKINSGTLGTARIPNLDASKITSGTFDAARIPNSTQYSDSDAVSAIESAQISSLRLENQEFDSTSADESRGVFVFDKSAGLAYFNDANNAPSGDLSGTDATKWHRVLDTDVLNTGSELTLSRNGTEGQIDLSVDQGSGSGLNADKLDGSDASDFAALDSDVTVKGEWTFGRSSSNVFDWLNFSRSGQEKWSLRSDGAQGLVFRDANNSRDVLTLPGTSGDVGAVIGGGAESLNTGNLLRLDDAAASTDDEIGMRFVDPTASAYGHRIYFSDTEDVLRLTGISNGTEVNAITIGRDTGNVAIAKGTTSSEALSVGGDAIITNGLTVTDGEATYSENNRVLSLRQSDGQGNAWIEVWSDQNSSAGLLLGNAENAQWEGRIQYNDSVEELEWYVQRDKVMSLESNDRLTLGSSLELQDASDTTKLVGYNRSNDTYKTVTIDGKNIKFAPGPNGNIDAQFDDAGRFAVGRETDAFVELGGFTRIAGPKDGDTPSSGSGLELVFDTGNNKSIFRSYDRDNSSYHAAQYAASSHRFRKGDVTIEGQSDVGGGTAPLTVIENVDGTELRMGGNEINSRTSSGGSALLALNNNTEGNVQIASGGGNTGVQNSNPQAPLDVGGRTQIAGDLDPATAYNHNIGSAAEKWLSLWAAELRVSTLVSQDERVTSGGRFVVGRSTELTRDLPSGDSTIHVRHNNLNNADYIQLEARGSVEFMRVVSSATDTGDDYAYDIRRDLDGTGANTWSEGDGVFNTGQNGEGFIDLYAVNSLKNSEDIDSNSVTVTGPSIAFTERDGDTSDAAYVRALSDRAVVGNLNSNFDYSSDTYGIAAGDPEGTYMAADPSNGFRIMSGTTKKIEFAPDGTGYIRDILQVGSGAFIGNKVNRKDDQGTAIGGYYNDGGTPIWKARGQDGPTGGNTYVQMVGRGSQSSSIFTAQTDGTKVIEVTSEKAIISNWEIEDTRITSDDGNVQFRSGGGSSENAVFVQDGPNRWYTIIGNVYDGNWNTDVYGFMLFDSDNGNRIVELTDRKREISGWKIRTSDIEGPNDDIRFTSSEEAVYARPRGSGTDMQYVMLGQTWDGDWTGNYGISAANGNDNVVFRLDDAKQVISGWRIEEGRLTNNGAVYLGDNLSSDWQENAAFVGDFDSSGSRPFIGARGADTSGGQNYVYMDGDGGSNNPIFRATIDGQNRFEIYEGSAQISGWEINQKRLINNGSVYFGDQLSGVWEADGGAYAGDFNGDGSRPFIGVRGPDGPNGGRNQAYMDDSGMQVKHDGTKVFDTRGDRPFVRGLDISGNLTTSALPSAPKDENLLALFRFDHEGDNRPLNYATGNRNSMAKGSMKYGSGVSGSAWDVDNDSYFTADVSDPSTDKFTISVWVYWRGYSGDGDSNEGICRPTGGTDEIGLWVDTSSGYLWGRVGGNNLPENSASQLSTNTWHHVCFVGDGSNGTLYIDGEQTAQTSYGGSISSFSGLGIGSQTGEQFNGKLDEFRYYDVALDRQERKALQVSPSGLGGNVFVEGAITANEIDTDNLFAQNIDFTGNLSQNINKKTVFQVSAEERKIMIADDAGNKTASLTKQGNLTINKIKNYQAISYDATSGNADSTPSTVKYYIDVNTPQGPGRIPVYETPDTQAPDTPSNLSVSDGTDFAFADIQFTASGDNGGSGIDYFNIYRAGTANGNYQIVKEVSGAANPGDTVLTSDGAVDAGNKYYWKVSAVDNAGNESSLSGYESAIITKDVDYQPPGDDDRLDRERA